MKQLMIARLRELIDYEPVAGHMTWRKPQSARVSPGDPVGGVAGNGRRYVGIDGARYLAHRLAWAHATGQWPAGWVSAKNDDYDDLRLDNLTLIDAADVSLKAGARRTSKSGVKGVCWDKSRGKWLATITRGYKCIHIGRFDSKDEAAEAFARKAAEIGRPVDDGLRQRRSTAVAMRTHKRLQWGRLQKRTSGITGWANFESFCVDVTEFPAYRADIVPVDPDRVVGPSNWQWGMRSKADYATPEGRRAYQTQHRATCRTSYKHKELLKSFGITLARYQELLIEQNGVCAICQKPEINVGRNGKTLSLAVDHCHVSGVVRSLLCLNCNQGIGSFRDDQELMRRAIEYIKRHAQQGSVVPIKRKVK